MACYSITLGFLLLIPTTGRMNGVSQSDAHVGYGSMSTIPSECLNGMMSPDFEDAKCTPPFLNHIVVLSANVIISDKLKALKRNVTKETYYTIELYKVEFRDNGTTYENQLRVLPQNYTIHTIIDEPPQDYSHGAPKLNVRWVEEVEGTSSIGWLPIPKRHLDGNGIPGSEKITFPMRVSDSLTLTRAYYRHIPSGVDIKLQ